MLLAALSFCFYSCIFPRLFGLFIFLYLSPSVRLQAFGLRPVFDIHTEHALSSITIVEAYNLIIFFYHV